MALPARLLLILNLDEVEAAIGDNTKLVLIENLGNPLSNIPDLLWCFSWLVHAHKIPLISTTIPLPRAISDQCLLMGVDSTVRFWPSFAHRRSWNQHRWHVWTAVVSTGRSFAASFRSLLIGRAIVVSVIHVMSGSSFYMLTQSTDSKALARYRHQYMSPFNAAACFLLGLENSLCTLIERHVSNTEKIVIL